MKIVLTISITTLLLFLTIVFAGGGHGTYIPAKVIYPFTMILAEHKGQIGILEIVLAIVQIPIYVILVTKTPTWKYYILAIHSIAVIVALNMYNGSFS